MKHSIARMVGTLRRSYRQDPTKFALRWTIVLLAVSLLVVKRSIWTPDTLLIIVLIIGVAFGKTREFLVRFVPFLGMLIAYDSFRSIADDLNTRVNYWPMIDFDRWLTSGDLPTTILQSWWHAGGLAWYDFYFYFLYTLHFLVPVIVGLLLWKYREKYYWPFAWALIGMSLAAFVTYVIFPAAPPWLAREIGLIDEPFVRLSSDIWAAMGVQNFSQFYAQISPNAVAAVPSLHSAYPLLAVMFIWKAFGFKKFWWLVFYPISMWIGVVYIGEHYAFDFLIAIPYVLVAYAVSLWFFRWYRAPKRRLRRWIDDTLRRLHLVK